jgi:hypothetical protein
MMVSGERSRLVFDEGGRKKQGPALRLVSLRNAIIALVAPEVGYQGFMSLIQSDF